MSRYSAVSFFIFHFSFSISATQPSPLEFLEAMSRAALERTGAEQLEIEGPDGKLVYWAAGEGPVVVLLHGTNDQAGLWWRTAASLKNRYRVIIPDMPGHGESAPATGPLDMSMMKNAVDSLLRAVSPDAPVTLVGNSMGGWAALLYTLDQPDRVSRLILEAPGGIALDTPPIVTLVPETIEEARAGFDAALGSDRSIPDPVLEDFVRRAPTSPAARLSERPWDGHLLDDRLGAIEVPTALIWGAEDGILPLPYGERMKSMIEGATLTVIPGCGHVLHNECPDQFLEALNVILGDTE